MFPLNVAAAAGADDPLVSETFTLTAEFIVSSNYTGFSLGAAGSIVPPTFQIWAFEALYFDHAANTFFFALNPDGIPNIDSTFVRIELEGIFDTGQETLVFERVNLSYLSQIPSTFWREFSYSGPVFVDANIYSVEIFYEPPP